MLQGDDDGARLRGGELEPERQGVESDRLADDRKEPCGAPVIRRQRVEVAQDERRERRRQRQFVGRGRRQRPGAAVTFEMPPREERLEHLLDMQRVAAGSVEQAAGEVAGRRGERQRRRQELGGLVQVEGAERQPGEAWPRQQAAQRRVTAGRRRSVLPQGCDNEPGRRRVARQQVLEQGDRRCAGPLKVFEEQHAGPSAREVIEALAECADQFGLLEPGRCGAAGAAGAAEGLVERRGQARGQIGHGAGRRQQRENGCRASPAPSSQRPSRVG